jgi:LmbE family N-acetylglucosaminyl deacetylase
MSLRVSLVFWSASLNVWHVMIRMYSLCWRDSRLPIKKTNQCAVIVAHPDDEALFFAGLILSKATTKWHVICVTNGNADGAGARRAEQFKESCRLLKIAKYEMWDFPDIFNKRLQIDELVSRFRELPNFKTVYTHGILGEYGHNHHQDVSFAVHTAFQKRSTVFSTAYNTYPQEKISLSAAQFAVKTKILWKVYGSEIQRLINFIPASSSEGFTKVKYSEVKNIYGALALSQSLDVRKLENYRWLGDWLNSGAAQLRSRPF